MDFDILAIIYDIPLSLFADRRDRQMRQLFTVYCLHRLLLENSVESAIHTLRNHKNYRVNSHEQTDLKTHVHCMPYEIFNECTALEYL